MSIFSSGLEADIIFSCGQCSFQTLNRGSFLSHTSEHENYSGAIRKQARYHAVNPDVTNQGQFYTDSNRMDMVEPMISERVVETIVDLSGAQSLLEVKRLFLWWMTLWVSFDFFLKFFLLFARRMNIMKWKKLLATWKMRRNSSIKILSLLEADVVLHELEVLILMQCFRSTFVRLGARAGQVTYRGI